MGGTRLGDEKRGADESNPLKKMGLLKGTDHLIFRIHHLIAMDHESDGDQK